FARAGDPRSTAIETVAAGAHRIRLTWYDASEPFVLNAPPGFNTRPIGVFSTFFPARSAQVEWNGRFATGQPWAETRGDRQDSRRCLGWSETWVEARQGGLAGRSSFRDAARRTDLGRQAERIRVPSRSRGPRGCRARDWRPFSPRRWLS